MNPLHAHVSTGFPGIYFALRGSQARALFVRRSVLGCATGTGNPHAPYGTRVVGMLPELVSRGLQW